MYNSVSVAGAEDRGPVSRWAIRTDDEPQTVLTVLNYALNKTNGDGSSFFQQLPPVVRFDFLEKIYIYVIIFIQRGRECDLL